MNIFVNDSDIDYDKYFLVKYFLQSRTSLRNAAWNLAIGQSVGNPNVRSVWETEELFQKHSCLIIGEETTLSNTKQGIVDIAFPIANIRFGSDGISQLLCQIAGGQMDIDDIEQCHVLDILFPSAWLFQSARNKGILEVRKFTGVQNKPLLGGIVKPKIGITPDTLVELVKALCDGGVNFIKEDEIMANPEHCPLDVRTEKVANMLAKSYPNVIYATCINSDPAHILNRAEMVADVGGNAIHVNWWSGLGAYKSIRELNLPLFIHFQKSGDRMITNEQHAYHIRWAVICKLAGLAGVDFIHAGMWGGYLNQDEIELKRTFETLDTFGVVPVLSCGMHPGLVEAIQTRFGVDWMANVGGAIHGHPDGTTAGAKAMRQAIDKNYGKEYWDAIEKWGKVE